MKSILKATAILGGSSLVTVFTGLVTAKVNAIELGPSGLGLFALLQSVIGIAGIIAGLGLSAAIVRFGAEAIPSVSTFGETGCGCELLSWEGDERRDAGCLLLERVGRWVLWGG